ncbi:MAG: V-type ATP synthase subunit D [Spirochaeta sp.]|nr:V-type ATP synthase subunit D [Spirochaeta sp.]
MGKIKFTKNELKKQKDALKRFQRYLPTLVLKKQQLQIEIRKVEVEERIKLKEQETISVKIHSWIEVFGEEVSLEELVKISSIQIETGNIAGVDIPLFRGIAFEEIEYDLFYLPLWVDKGVENINRVVALAAEIETLREQIRLLGEELRITTQRVNLFEKVKIPDTKENIRLIQIYMGDQQTAAVVRGKMAKNKLVKVS